MDLSQQRWNGDECATQRLGAQHVLELVDLGLIGVNARVLRGMRRVFKYSFVRFTAAVDFHAQRGRPRHLVVSFIAVFIRFSQRLLVQRTQLGEIDWRHDFNKDVQVSDGFFLTQLGKIRVNRRLVRSSGLIRGSGLGFVAGHVRLFVRCRILCSDFVWVVTSIQFFFGIVGLGGEIGLDIGLDWIRIGFGHGLRLDSDMGWDIGLDMDSDWIRIRIGLDSDWTWVEIGFGLDSDWIRIRTWVLIVMVSHATKTMTPKP